MSRKNPSEFICERALNDLGLSPSKRGWPDFWWIDLDGKLCAAEVKPRSTQPLKKEQKVILSLLESFGVRTFKFSPDGGFQSTSNDPHLKTCGPSHSRPLLRT